MPAHIEQFTTPRLAASRLLQEDFPEYCTLGSDPQVRAWLGGKLLSEEEVRATLDASQQHWQRHGFGIWTLRIKESGQFIGRVGLRHCAVEGQPEIELLYTLLPEFWNQGLATEASHEVLRIGRQALRLPSIVAFTLPTNIASRRVMEKCGLLYERPILHADLPHELFRTS